LIALLFSWSVAAKDLIFGPTQFVREKGKPETVKDTFLADPGSGYRFVVQNGEPASEKSRVKSALILLNGNTIFSPEDFKKEVFLLEHPVSPQATNQLEVRVAGKPGSFPTLSIVGNLRTGHPAADAEPDQHTFDRMTKRGMPFRAATVVLRTIFL